MSNRTNLQKYCKVVLNPLSHIFMKTHVRRGRTHVPTICYIRGVSGEAHDSVGKSLGLGGESNPDSLHEEMMTDQGPITFWDCGLRDIDTCRRLIIDFLGRGQEVELYVKRGDGIPTLLKEDLSALRKEVRARSESPHMKAAKMKLAAMVRKKNKQRKLWFAQG